MLRLKGVLSASLLRRSIQSLLSMEVLQDSNKSRFYIALDTGEEAELLYEVREGVMDMYHTEVPTSQRGKGVGGKLAQFALDYARGCGLMVTPTCTFIQHYITKNPQYQECCVSKT